MSCRPPYLRTSRRDGRELAMTVLYAADCQGLAPEVALADLDLAPDEFVVDLVRGVGANLGRLDELISGRSEGWPLHRMPVLDRVVLRLGTFELVYRPDRPAAAVINEAVELAKTYSTPDSGRFVNGVLAAIAAENRPAVPDGEGVPPATLSCDSLSGPAAEQAEGRQPSSGSGEAHTEQGDA